MEPCIFAVWSIGSSDGIGGSWCRREPAGFRDCDAAALGRDKQSQGHRQIPHRERSCCRRGRRRVGFYTFALGDKVSELNCTAVNIRRVK